MQEGLGLKGRVQITAHDSKTGKLVSQTPWFDNLIMFGAGIGRQLILDRLSGTNTYSLNITTCGIGTSNTAPTIADTNLNASVLVVGSPVITIASNVLTFKFFFPDGALANGTYYEVGTFVDGTQMFNHALFSPGYAKTAGTDTTVTIDFTST